MSAAKAAKRVLDLEEEDHDVNRTQKPYFRKQIHSPYFASQIRGKYGKSVAVNTFVYLIQHYVIEFDK
jgi:hypothetical protein